MGGLVYRCAVVACRAFRPWSRELDQLVASLRGTLVPVVSPRLADALVQAEDHRFRRHCGVDLRAVLRAIYKTVCCGQRQGASTIEQQLVRVSSGRFETTLRRKVREIALAVALGGYFTKDTLLTLYLVRGYYGYGMTGLHEACVALGIDAASLSFGEAASLVARLKYPEPRTCSPKQRARIDGRTQHILRRLVRPDHPVVTQHAAEVARTDASAAADA